MRRHAPGVALRVLSLAALTAACAAPAPPVATEAPLQAQWIPAGLELCSDYGSNTGTTGAPYHLVSEDGRVITRHEGIDFCAPCGVEVIAPTTGEIVRIERDDPRQGGRVTIRMGDALYGDALHITPAPGLAEGATVNAGDRIGEVGPAGLHCVGPRAHVHLSVRAGLAATTHLNPHEYWRDGPGEISCFARDKPSGPGKIVAPLRC